MPLQGALTSPPAPHRYRLLAQEPHSIHKFGREWRVGANRFPISQTMTGVIIDLEPGGIETFQYDSSTLGLVTYELAVVSVNGHTAASTASLRHGVRRAVAPAAVSAGPIHGDPVPVPLSSAQVSNLMLSRGVLAPAPQLVGATG